MFIKNFIKEHWIRVVEFVVLLLITLIGYGFHDEIVNYHLNSFSYYASVITFVAFLIAILEILYTLYKTKSIAMKVADISNQNKSYAISLFANETIFLLEDVEKSILDNDYKSARSSLKLFSRNFERIPGDISKDKENKEKKNMVIDFVNLYYSAVDFNRIPIGRRSTVLKEINNLKDHISSYSRDFDPRMK